MQNINEDTISNDIVSEGIIPYNLDFHTNVSSQQAMSQPFEDPGAVMAQAWSDAMSNAFKPPKVEIPEPRLSKQDQYIRDLISGICPIPAFGVEDTRPATQGELEAQLHPEPIYEPLAQEVTPGFQYSDNGTSVLDYNFNEVPTNGMPDIHF